MKDVRMDKAKILTEKGYVYGSLITQNGTIKDIIEEDIKKTEKIIIPGFFDEHTHGANGLDFSTIRTKVEINEILEFYIRHGVTSVFPTLLTENDDLIFNQLELIYEASKTHPEIKGIHLEGPFLSNKFKGAQLEKYLQVPNVLKCKKFIKHSHGLLKLMTLAPENQNSEEVIKYLTNNNIAVLLGHSDATRNETKIAMDLGAKCITHLFNSSRGVEHHNPSITSAGLYYDDLYTEIILDGVHVDPQMVELVRKIKTNDKIIGISDSLMCAGLGSGEYQIGNTPIIVNGNDCKIKDTSIRAGSNLTMDQAFRNIKQFCNLSDFEASKICTLNSAKMLKMDDKIGTLAVGKKADFIVFDNDYNIKEVYVNGAKRY